MTCAETRRQLPEPDPALAPQVEAHLDGCGPCRVESDALKEIDRRLLRLAATRRATAEQAWRQRLDRRAPSSAASAAAAAAAAEAASKAQAQVQVQAQAAALPGPGPSPAEDPQTRPLPLPPAAVPGSRPLADYLTSLFPVLLVAVSLGALLWHMLRLKH